MTAYIRRPAPVITIHAEGDTVMTIGNPPVGMALRTGGLVIEWKLAMKRKYWKLIRQGVDWWRVFTALHARKSRVEYPKKASVRFLRGR